MNINSPDFVPVQEFKGCLEIQRQEFSSLKGVKKNGLWLLWHTPTGLLRQEGALDTGFILRGCPDLSGGGGSAGIVSEVREGEAGETGLAGEQSILYKAVCLLCRSEVSHDDSAGCGEGTTAGLANRKDIGQGVYGEAASPQSCKGAWGDRGR